MSCHLLPPNRTPLEAALADATRLDIDLSRLRGISDSTRAPTPLLPWLAWERSIENFDSAISEEQQRELIRTSIRIHRRKGTVAPVREVFRALGLGEVVIQEGNNHYLADGALTADGFGTAGDPDGWVEYRVQIDKLLSVEQSRIARAVLADVAPARSVLWGIDFTGASLIANGLAIADGSYTAGVVNT